MHVKYIPRFCKLTWTEGSQVEQGYSKPMIRRPSSSSSVVVVHTFKLEYLWGRLANLDQVLYMYVAACG